MLRNIIRHLNFIIVKLCSIALAAVLCLTLTMTTADAKRSKQTRSSKQSGSPFDDSKYAALIINATSGEVLYQKNAGKLRYPASLTKLMTLYLAFDALDRGQISMNTTLRVSGKAASQAPTKLGLQQGGRITVRDAIMSLIVLSANDAAVVLAEGIAGSEARFAQMMNERARSLGMISTHFENASGLPNKEQQSNAIDFSRLAMALQREHAAYYPLFSTTRYNYHGRTLVTHNRVLQNYRGADGLKTGYINASGFNLVTSAKRGSTRLIGVVFGGSTGRARDQHMIKLLDENFAKLESKSTIASAPGSSSTGFAPIPVFKPSSLDVSPLSPPSSQTIATPQAAVITTTAIPLRTQGLPVPPQFKGIVPTTKPAIPVFQLSDNTSTAPMASRHGNVPYPVFKPIQY